MNETMKIRSSNRNMATFVISKMISTLGANVLAFGIGLYILALTGSAMNFAITMICTTLPRILLSPIVGYIADNYPKKPIVLISQAVSMSVMLGLFLYAETFGISLFAIYTTLTLYAMSSTFTSVTFSASIASLVAPEHIQKAMSFNQMSISVAAIGGPVLGGILFGTVAIETFLLLHMAAYLIAFLLEITMDFKLYSTQQTEEKESMLASLKGGFTYVKQHELIKTIMYIAFWVNLFFTAVTVGMMFILVELLAIKPVHVGLIEGATALGMLIASILFATMKELQQPFRMVKVGLSGLAFVMVALVVPVMLPIAHYGMKFVYYIVVAFTTAVFIMMINMPVGVVMQKNTDEAYRGRVFGLLEMMALSTMPIASAIYGTLIDLLPVQYVFITSAIGLFVIVQLLLPTRKLAHFKRQALIKSNT